jgi:hypothetical protein
MVNQQSGWEIRGAQLDVARQLETVDYICRFIDFIAEHGYNLLVLYLEGRLRTKTFPYLAESESYTPDQMHQVVKYAAAKGIDVMPIVPTLGYTGHFLNCHELEHLAELRGGGTGRFRTPGNEYLDVFCPSLPETYEFLEAYLTEIADIFPYKYLHVGCDEAWNIGYCPLCRDRAEHDGGESDIFAEHLSKVHQIVAEKLGRKMMIWDDLFEHYESALSRIPKDIVLCSWHYGNMENPPYGHFANQIREDAFAKYDSLGFDYIFAPREQTLGNITSFTDYARRYNAIGGILTSWVKTCTMLDEYFPNIAFAGKLWSSDSNLDAKRAATAVIKKIFRTEDRNLVDTVYALESILPLPRAYDTQSFLYGPLNARKRERGLFAAMAGNLLEQYRPGIDEGMPGDVMDGLIVRTGTESLQCRLLELSYKVYAGLNGLLNFEPSIIAQEIQLCLEEIGNLQKVDLAQWDRLRPGISPIAPEAKWNTLRESFKSLSGILSGKEDTGMFIVDFFLPDMHTAQRTEISVQEEGSQEWVSIAQGVFKPELATEAESAYYTRFFPIRKDARIARCRINTYGYGGQGFTFVKIVNSAGHRVPYALLGIDGRVENPENLFSDDRQWCFMGEQDIRYAFKNRGLESSMHTVIIEMH